MGGIGAAATDAQRQLVWLSRQVAPVVKRLASVYGVAAVAAVLFDARDPASVLPLQPVREEGLADYDSWTVENAERFDLLSAI